MSAPAERRTRGASQEAEIRSIGLRSRMRRIQIDSDCKGLQITGGAGGTRLLRRRSESVDAVPLLDSTSRPAPVPQSLFGSTLKTATKGVNPATSRTSVLFSRARQTQSEPPDQGIHFSLVRVPPKGSEASPQQPRQGAQAPDFQPLALTHVQTPLHSR